MYTEHLSRTVKPCAIKHCPSVRYTLMTDEKAVTQ